jgi:hypothetical protein
MDESDDSFLTTIIHFAEFVAQIGVLLMLCGAGILGYQGFLWLKNGYWTAMPVGDFLPQIPIIDWSGASRLLKKENRTRFDS